MRRLPVRHHIDLRYHWLARPAPPAGVRSAGEWAAAAEEVVAAMSEPEPLDDSQRWNAAGEQLIYTICFCRHHDRILLLKRSRQPNKGLWNGLGGRIEPGEMPRASIIREMMEEAAIDLSPPHRLRFGGVVSWSAGDDLTRDSTGMFVYLAEMAAAWTPPAHDQPTVEGLLGWHPLAWVCDQANGAVVSTIARFLPPMLQGTPPSEYACTYQGSSLMQVQMRDLPARLIHAGRLGEPGMVGQR